MATRVRYSSDDDGVVVTVRESHPENPGRVRRLRKDFGKSAKAADDGLIFVHSLNHGEIKTDDILPPWED